MAYTSEANVEAYLGETFDSTTTPSSTEIAKFIEWADNQIDMFTGTKFEPTTVTDEIIDSNGQSWFRLPKRPIISVESFYVDKAGLGSSNSPDWEARTEGRTSSDDFVVYKDEGYLYFFNDVPSAGKANCKVSYTYGYSTVPKEVEYLSTLLVVREILKARLADNAYSSQDDITLGPIRISKSGSKSSIGVQELNEQIEEAWKAVGKFKITLY